MSGQASLHLVLKLPEGTKDFDVPVEIGMTLLDALLYIRQERDPSISFNWNCRTAQCGICAVVVNGKVALACMRSVRSSDEYLVEPIYVERHLKGLVCDVSDIFKEYFLACPPGGAELSKKLAFEQLLLNLRSPALPE
jgi:succinate dehydrogenase/fumarate reductase iron-sulfur protein